MLKLGILQKLKKLGKSVQGAILSRKGAKGSSSSGGLSGAAAPGGGPKYTHASKERRGRQKERRTKKERVRHVEQGTKGFEHASGQRPGE